MRLSLQPGRVEDAAALAALHVAVAEHLTLKHGRGPWSSRKTERGVLFGMRTSRVFVVRDGKEIVATFRLATRKPWAIDVRYFTACRKPLYLVDMAVAPARQRQGVGRWCLEQARVLAGAWPADAIRLDAYDAEAGGGPFYARCGFREVGRASYRDVALIYFELLLSPQSA
jgi:GNAT superfamily N-acetyltransferase